VLDPPRRLHGNYPALERDSYGLKLAECNSRLGERAGAVHDRDRLAGQRRAAESVDDLERTGRDWAAREWGAAVEERSPRRD
jgi:hypothetical protein